MARSRRAAGLAAALAAVALGSQGAAARSSSAGGPVRVGVLLTLSGPNALDVRTALNWAVANVNRAGGIGGRPLQLVVRDLARESVSAGAASLASDRSVAAVVGPDTSTAVYQVAPAFFDADKVFISPSATSADLDRSFVGTGPNVFWRTVQSDVSQTRVLLDAAVSGGARSVALVATNDDYGTTFFDWVGFLATELGVKVTYTGRFDPATQSCTATTRAALATRPSALIATPESAGSALCMARLWKSTGSRSRLLFSDAGEIPSIVPALTRLDPKLEGTGPAPDPPTHFAAAYEQAFHASPPPYAANAYDAVLLIALGLERSHGQRGEALRAAIAALTEPHRGPHAGWDAAGIASALAVLRGGRVPVVAGAAGPLADTGSPPTPVSTAYELWRLGPHGFVPVTYYATLNEPGVVNSRTEFTRLARRATPSSNVGGQYTPPPRAGEWALLVAASDGWLNYRHQADVMAQYQILRSRGVPASHIVVVSADDLTNNPSNPKPGYVPNVAGGPNLATGFQVDYPIEGMTAADLMAILSGHASAALPYVLHPGPGDDVYVYIAGHGNANGVYLGLDTTVLEPGTSYPVLTPALLGSTVSAMSTQHEYRRMLIVIDACQSGTFTPAITAPGALIATSAGAAEDSLAANYSPAAKTWLADQFSYDLSVQERNAPSQSLAALLEHTLYDEVSGSHVAVAGPEFGAPLLDVELSEFISP